MGAEGGLLEEPGDEAVILDIEDVLLFERSLAEAGLHLVLAHRLALSAACLLLGISIPVVVAALRHYFGVFFLGFLGFSALLSPLLRGGVCGVCVVATKCSFCLSVEYFAAFTNRKGSLTCSLVVAAFDFVTCSRPGFVFIDFQFLLSACYLLGLKCHLTWLINETKARKETKYDETGLLRSPSAPSLCLPLIGAKRFA